MKSVEIFPTLNDFIKDEVTVETNWVFFNISVRGPVQEHVYQIAYELAKQMRLQKEFRFTINYESINKILKQPPPKYATK